MIYYDIITIFLLTVKNDHPIASSNTSSLFGSTATYDRSAWRTSATHLRKPGVSSEAKRTSTCHQGKVLYMLKHVQTMIENDRSY